MTPYAREMLPQMKKSANNPFPRLTGPSLPIRQRGSIIPLQTTPQQRQHQALIQFYLRRAPAKTSVEREGVTILVVAGLRVDSDRIALRRGRVVGVCPEDVDAAFRAGFEGEEGPDSDGYLDAG